MSVREVVEKTYKGEGVSQNDIVYVVTEYICEKKNISVNIRVRQNNSIIATYDIDALMRAYSYAEKHYIDLYGI